MSCCNPAFTPSACGLATTLGSWLRAGVPAPVTAFNGRVTSGLTSNVWKEDPRMALGMMLASHERAPTIYRIPTNSLTLFSTTAYPTGARILTESTGLIKTDAFTATAALPTSTTITEADPNLAGPTGGPEQVSLFSWHAPLSIAGAVVTGERRSQYDRWDVGTPFNGPFTNIPYFGVLITISAAPLVGDTAQRAGTLLSDGSVNTGGVTGRVFDTTPHHGIHLWVRNTLVTGEVVTHSFGVQPFVETAAGKCHVLVLSHAPLSGGAYFVPGAARAHVSGAFTVNTVRGTPAVAVSCDNYDLGQSASPLHCTVRLLTLNDLLAADCRAELGVVDALASMFAEDGVDPLAMATLDAALSTNTPINPVFLSEMATSVGHDTPSTIDGDPGQHVTPFCMGGGCGGGGAPPATPTSSATRVASTSTA